MSTQWKFILIIFACFTVSACANRFGGGQLDVTQMYTARDFLISKQTEKNTYGLYSYLIFSRPPCPEMEKRYKAAIRTYLSYPTVASTEVYLPQKELNIFYLLVGKKPPPQILECLYSQCVNPKEEHISWIIENYDYARAKIILRAASDSLRYGPYIISTRQPMSLRATAAAEQIMIQDMTKVPPKLVEKWVYCFLNRATGRGSAFNRSLDQMRLVLISELEKFAEGLPEVISAILYLHTISSGANDSSLRDGLIPSSVTLSSRQFCAFM